MPEATIEAGMCERNAGRPTGRGPHQRLAACSHGIRPVKVRIVDPFHGRRHGAGYDRLNVIQTYACILERPADGLTNEFGIRNIRSLPALSLAGSNNCHCLSHE